LFGFDGLIEKVLLVRKLMADVFYGIAGDPVSHSISPLLLSIVAQHLEQQGKCKSNLSIQSLNLIEAKSIQDALAWGYAKSIPNPLNWDYTGSPFGKFRNRALIQKALEVTEKVITSNTIFENKSDNISKAKFPFSSTTKLPKKAFSEEIWINLTSPLKHQLTSKAVMDFNDSSLIESVNVLRWDGHGWWSSNVDGSGVVRCAEFFGIDVSKGAVLCILGGGGAARSTAHAWAKSGGKLKILDGRRNLKGGLWSNSIIETNSCDIFINFDSDEIPDELIIDRAIISPRYDLMEGTVDQRCELLIKPQYDGRWMLIAQHLECWRQLWAPQYIDYLPSIELLMTKLIHAEIVLSSYT